MIDYLKIKNFKSIKEMDLGCRRINLFIGDANTGKSNILEALGLLCWHNHHHLGFETKLNQYLRFEEILNIFYNGLLDEKIEIIINKGIQFSIEIMPNYFGDRYRMECKIGGLPAMEEKDKIESWLDIVPSGEAQSHRIDINGTPTLYKIEDKEKFEKFYFLKYYKFLNQSNFPFNFNGYLLPPNGANLYALVMANKEIRELMNTLFEGFDLNFMMKTGSKTFETLKQISNMSINFPFAATSDTLHKILFYYTAMESNKNSTLVFDNPLATASPYYTKHFGERIAFDDSNQYFISTHNLYLLTGILEKAPRDSVNVFITYLKDYNTRVRKLNEEEIPILLDSDPFFNAKYFIEKE